MVAVGTSHTKSALVTGASRGIGRGIALRLASEGFGLTVTSRNAADLDQLEPELRAAGSPTVASLAADMADSEALPALTQLHEQTFGHLNALILNAGVGTAGPIASFKTARVSKTFDVNFGAAFVLIREALPLLRRAAEADATRGARVIALSSITGAYAEAGLAVYGASKAALLSLIETLNLEEAANGINATAIAPGFVETDMSAWTVDTIPADTMIKVDDIVSVVSMLLELSRNATISRLVMTRSGSNHYSA